ncbi:MAG: TetR/AcrR family transcriptional regulator [Chloroflexi bacterium]|nr:TetR/AcrR family transcriptional regulator [Chloroflexota bacterium]
MAPKVSEEHMEERRQQILDAAVRSFSRGGLHQTTIEDIRLEAELSRGAVYHYFKTKEDIIDAIRERSAGQAESFYRESSGGDDGAANLLNLVDATLSLMTSPESAEANRLALFLWAESLVNQRIMDGQLPSFKPYLEQLARSFAEAQDEGRADPQVDSQAIARVIAGTMLGLQIQLTWEPDMDMDAAGRALELMLAGKLWSSDGRASGGSAAAGE